MESIKPSKNVREEKKSLKSKRNAYYEVYVRNQVVIERGKKEAWKEERNARKQVKSKKK